MKVLLLAPHPFFQDRGTPIAVDLLVRTLAERGEQVDVLAYHEGETKTYPGRVAITRIKPPARCTGIRPGLSLKKLRCDAAMHREAMRMAARTRYDLVHAVEESVFMAMRIEQRFGVPYVFDMDSSMPHQIVERFPFLRPLLPAMQVFERRAARGAMAVTAVCDALGEIARGYGAANVVLLRDVPMLDHAPAGDSAPAGFRDALGLRGLAVLYVGNLEKYQGIELLLRSFARLPRTPEADLVIVGGAPAHIETYRALAEELGIGSRTHFLGPRPIAHLGRLMQDADLLVSPRTQGSNTPMKIYSYMASGKALLATNLPTHTQVLHPGCALLAEPEPEAFSQAMIRLAGDPGLREHLGRQARAEAEANYSLSVFRNTVNALYDWIAQRVAAPHSPPPH